MEKISPWEEKIKKLRDFKITAQALLGLRQLTWYSEWRAIEIFRKILEEKKLPLIEEIGRAPLPTKHGDYTYIAFGDRTTGFHHEALIYGNLEEGSLGDGKNILVRIHSSCRTNEAYDAVNCECRSELTETLERIKNEGRGILLYLEQEGRGTGIFGKLHQLNNMFQWQNGSITQRIDDSGKRINTDKAYKMAGFPSEVRDFAIAAEILNYLGVKSVKLVTNNPNKIKMLEAYGISTEREPIHILPENPIIASDLESKSKELGHLIPPEYYNYNDVS